MGGATCRSADSEVILTIGLFVERNELCVPDPSDSTIIRNISEDETEIFAVRFSSEGVSVWSALLSSSARSDLLQTDAGNKSLHVSASALATATELFAQRYVRSAFGFYHTVELSIHC